MDPLWTVTYKDYNPEKEGLREALCTLGNGYFATRGAHEESKNDQFHYPGTYLAGGYNRLKSDIAGQVIENEDLVNFPNWLVLRFKPEGGDWFSLDEVKIHDYEQSLHLYEGILTRKIHIEDKEGRETYIESTRMVHMDYEHLAAIQWKFTPKNWSGNIIIHSALDGSVINNGVERYSDLSSRHLKSIDLGQFEESGIYLKTQTRQSEIIMAQASKTEVIFDDAMTSVIRETIRKDDYIAQELRFPVEKNREVRIEKTLAVYTSRDDAISDPLFEAQKAILRADSFDSLRLAQNDQWKEIWKRVDNQISCKYEEEQLVLRLHIFHLMQTVSTNSIDLDIGVPSRGWHGEAYRGHILWDELFIFPFLTLSMPELNRSLLMYRYRRLPEARYNARENGYEGAMFPWQSGSDGREESQKIHLNPQSGNWIPDDSRLQRHVNAAIAYNVWRYYQVTNDQQFLHFHGAELILDITRFWASKVSWSDEKQRYEINKVVGPDEYHTSYPEAKEPGINNNAYTNIMVIWVFKHALDLLEILDERRRAEILAKLKITKEDTDRWDRISRNIFVPWVEENKILSQYEGFEELEELDWDHYHNKYGEILRLDRIMEKEGDDVNRYRATKQADVLMLFYLFSSEELTSLLQRCGYDFNPKSIPDNVKYYQDRTAHGSTLSKLVHSWVMARSDRTQSWHNFKKALMSDFKDIQGGTTAEGIHLGAMAGTVDLIQRCYTGLVIRSDKLFFNPQLPKELSIIKFNIRYRGIWIKVKLHKNELSLTREGGWNEDDLEVMIKDEAYVLKPGEKKKFKVLKTKVELLS